MVSLYSNRKETKMFFKEFENDKKKISILHFLVFIFFSFLESEFLENIKATLV